MVGCHHLAPTTPPVGRAIGLHSGHPWPWELPYFQLSRELAMQAVQPLAPLPRSNSLVGGPVVRSPGTNLGTGAASVPHQRPAPAGDRTARGLPRGG